jgi:hypothetical protein
VQAIMHNAEHMLSSLHVQYGCEQASAVAVAVAAVYGLRLLPLSQCKRSEGSCVVLFNDM